MEAIRKRNDFHDPNMTTNNPMNIPVIDKDTEAGELLDVVDGLVVDPVDVGLVVVELVVVGLVVVEGVVLAELVVAAPVV